MDVNGHPARLRIRRLHRLPEEERSPDPDVRESDARRHERQIVAEIVDAKIRRMMDDIDAQRAELKEYILSIVDSSEAIR